MLYYSYNDKHTWQKMFQNENLDSKMKHLCDIVAYCENHIDCRREIVLEYFGEYFDKEKCTTEWETTCNNCYNSKKGENCTEISIKIVNWLQKINSDFTLIQLGNALLGNKDAALKTKGICSTFITYYFYCSKYN